jgi:hypothetical protein
MTSPPLSRYSGINCSNDQPRAFRSFSAVVTRTLVWPASIFCRGQTFKSANFASRCWVIFLPTRSHLKLAPKLLICRIVPLLETPYHPAIVAMPEQHEMP